MLKCSGFNLPVWSGCYLFPVVGLPFGPVAIYNFWSGLVRFYPLRCGQSDDATLDILERVLPWECLQGVSRTFRHVFCTLCEVLQQCLAGCLEDVAERSGGAEEVGLLLPLHLLSALSRKILFVFLRLGLA